MTSSNLIRGDGSQKVHPNEANHIINDENKNLTEHNGTTSEIHGKTEAHERTNTRRKSDAERHAYADAHLKDRHPGIKS
jgi:hypothetical protein